MTLPSKNSRSVQQNTEGTNLTSVVKKFLEYDPPTFNGLNPTEAVYWLKNIVRIFKEMNVSEKQQVLLAVIMLEGAALEWWKSVQMKLVRKDPIEADNWLKYSVIKEVKNVGDEKRERCKSSERTHGRKVVTRQQFFELLYETYSPGTKVVTWQQFAELFREMFLPVNYLALKEKCVLARHIGDVVASPSEQC